MEINLSESRSRENTCLLYYFDIVIFSCRETSKKDASLKAEKKPKDDDGKRFG